MDLPYLRDMIAFARGSALVGRPFYLGIIIGNRGFMGPIIKPDTTSCWICCLIRLQYDFLEEGLRNSFRTNYVHSNLPFGPEFTPDNGIAKMVGAEVAFELFKAQAGDIRPEIRSCMQVYTADKQGSIRVELAPHPPDSCIGLCNMFGRRQTEYHITTNIGDWLRAHSIHHS